MYGKRVDRGVQGEQRQEYEQVEQWDYNKQINKRQIDDRRTEEEAVSGWDGERCTVRSVRTFVVHEAIRTEID